MPSLLVRPSLRRARFGVGVALVLAAIFLTGGGSVSRGLGRVELPSVYLEAEPLAGADAPERARALAEAYLEAPITVALESGERVFSRRELGVSVDVEALEKLVEQALTPESDVLRAFASRGGGEELRLALSPQIDPGPLKKLLLPEKERLDRGAREASYDFERGEIVEDRDGLLLDLYGTLTSMVDALHRGETRLRVHMIARPAKRREKDLAGARFDAALSEFQTRYSRAADARLRTENLIIAAEKIDKTVLLPGEIFDFNAVVGPRTAVGGFKPAPVIAAGEIVDGIGGGACQISGTLHAAAVFAGLEITERKPHSRPSSYIRMGLDAMVSYPNLNFRFRNDRPYPVAIRMSVEGGFVTAKIMGPAQDRGITFVRRVREVTPYPETMRPDPSLPSGVTVLSQRGVPGFRVELARIHKDAEGNELSIDRTLDVYPPTAQIWRVGSGPAAPEGYEPPSGDKHAEYRADEYLEMAQGPGIKGTQEVRRAGRTGTPGWTLAEGMPSPTR